MEKVHFETNPTNESEEYSQLIDTILIVLNRVSVELTLESQRNQSLSYDQFRVAIRLVHSAVELGTMLPDLINEQSIRLPFALPIARMFYERLLSAAYVLSDGGPAAKQAIHYAVYSVFKNQKKLFSAGGYKEVIPGRLKVSRESKEVVEALEYFKNARVVREFEHDRHERCEVIGKVCKKAALHFQSVEQAGYSLSSEIVHGSYLSTILYSDQPREGTPETGLHETTTWIMIAFVFSSEALGHLLRNICPSLPSPPLLIDAGKTFMKFEVPEAADLIDCAYRER
ncbi:hypothetical protein [Roseinatronobacter sp.]|uniref:hypothetical protein n=1 Tax=Roseinatronobacter sp. TaxID=1945755 RepID=UPI0025ECF7F0|nr:hypothetical protein [Roseibaca sp.]